MNRDNLMIEGTEARLTIKTTLPVKREFSYETRGHPYGGRSLSKILTGTVGS